MLIGYMYMLQIFASVIYDVSTVKNNSGTRHKNVGVLLVYTTKDSRGLTENIIS